MYKLRYNWNVINFLKINCLDVIKLYMIYNVTMIVYIRHIQRFSNSFFFLLLHSLIKTCNEIVIISSHPSTICMPRASH